LFEDERFSIDPTHKQFKNTSASKTIMHHIVKNRKDKIQSEEKNQQQTKSEIQKLTETVKKHANTWKKKRS